MTNQARTSPSFNPYAWGTLFFTSWLILTTIPDIGTAQTIIAWVFFGLSCILWLAVFIRPLDKPFGAQITKQTILPLVFLLTPFALIMGSVAILPQVPQSFQIIVPIGTVLWLFIYLTIFVWSFKPKRLGAFIGIGASTFFIITGVIHFFRAAPPTQPWCLIFLGLALLTITLLKSKIGREFPF